MMVGHAAGRVLLAVAAFVIVCSTSWTIGPPPPGVSLLLGVGAATTTPRCNLTTCGDCVDVSSLNDSRCGWCPNVTTCVPIDRTSDGLWTGDCGVDDAPLLITAGQCTDAIGNDQHWAVEAWESIVEIITLPGAIVLFVVLGLLLVCVTGLCCYRCCICCGCCKSSEEKKRDAKKAAKLRREAEADERRKKQRADAAKRRQEAAANAAAAPPVTDDAGAAEEAGGASADEPTPPAQPARSVADILDDAPVVSLADTLGMGAAAAPADGDEGSDGDAIEMDSQV